MGDHNCGNCRYYLAEEAESGDCLSMVSGRVKTSASDTCRAHAHQRIVSPSLHEPIAEET